LHLIEWLPYVNHEDTKRMSLSECSFALSSQAKSRLALVAVALEANSEVDCVYELGSQSRLQIASQDLSLLSSCECGVVVAKQVVDAGTLERIWGRKFLGARWDF
jgi:hypothetical protein